jgi:hypothetical protein
MTTHTLRNTWLVQRLGEPLGRANPFSFGGGYKNGGLSDEAFALLDGIFSFDYMGAAEYEFGSVPKTFQKIAESASEGDLTAFKVEVLLSEIPPAYGDKTKPARGSKGVVYFLADASIVPAVRDRIYEMATGKVLTKGDHMLERVLRPRPDAPWSYKTIGGLEIDNGFIYFTNRDAFVKTAELFGLDVGGL